MDAIDPPGNLSITRRENSTPVMAARIGYDNRDTMRVARTPGRINFAPHNYGLLAKES